MASRARGRVSWLARKTGDLLGFERDLATAVELSPRDRMRLGVAGHRAVLHDAREVPFLGEPFAYDNRFTPILLPAYLAQARRIRAGMRTTAVDTVLDVGANVGQFAAAVLGQSPAARIWSFEPNPQILPLLERNARPHPAWTVLPYGIGPDDDSVDLWVTEGKSGQGSLRRENAVLGLRAASPVALRVALRKLTAERLRALDVPPVVDLLKVDVEGAERSVLQGLAAVQWRYLALEFSGDSARGLTLPAAIDLIESIWRRRPETVWSDDASRGAADALLALPCETGESASTIGGSHVD